MKRVVLISMCVSVALLVACAKIPQAPIDEAREALASAKAEAGKWAADSLVAAENKAAELDAELAVQKGKLFKNYDKTLQLARELKDMSEKAVQDAENAKAAAKAEAEAAVTQAETTLTAAREALAKAPKGKGSAADIAAMTGDLDAAAATIATAKTDLANENFEDAKTKAASATQKADSVVNEVNVAIEMQQSLEKGHTRKR
jgi:hypothetical protein